MKIQQGTPFQPPQAIRPSAKAKVRFVNDVALQVGMGDLPTAAAIGASLVAPKAKGLGDALNTVNFVANAVGTVIDLKQMRDVFKSEKATRTDKIVEVGHLLIGDILPTLTSLMPTLAGLHGPLAQGFFLATQGLGIVTDFAKTGYDIHRAGAQGD